MGGRVRALGGLPRSRVVTALALVVVGLPALTAFLVAVRDDLPRESVLLVYMLSVVGVAVVGGWLPALLAAAAAFALANWFFTPPYNTFVVNEQSALLDLVVFLLTAVVVSVAVEVGARHRAATPPASTATR